MRNSPRHDCKNEFAMSSGQPSLLAGTGRRCTNPPPNIAHGGWGAQKHEQAEGIDMDLWVTALVLSDQVTTAVILDVDIQILTNERADQLRRAVHAATGLPMANIRACATHTHSGPVPYKSWIEKGYELVGPWFEDLARWCAEAAEEAVGQLQPVKVRTGRGNCQINASRRAATPQGDRFLGINPTGACDHEVLVVRLDAVGGPPVATLVNYACHPTIMGPPNRLITPDYPGAMKRVVEQAVGGRCLFLQGSAGDQGPVQGFQGEVQVYRGLGAILGHEAARMALSLRQVPAASKFREVIPSGAPLGMYDSEFPTCPALPLCVLEKEIQVPLREGLPERKIASEKLAHWQGKLKAARADADEAAITEAIYMARRADIQLRMAEDFGGKTSAGVRTHVITFGDFAMAGCNIEPFCEIGLEIKRRSPFPTTFMCGYTNGRMAYMATAEEWPKGGYEVENSPFGEHAAEVLVREILQELHRMKNSPNLGLTCSSKT
jgi:Neutral/alkaline non-lysosomal ceramidase, N-terminal